MLADYPLDVLLVGACLAAEARGIGAELHGQLRLFEYFTGEHVGDRHFGGRDHVKVLLLNLVLLFREFRELPRAHHCFLIHHERREHFGVAVHYLLVQHEIDERALEAGGKPL